VDKRCIQGNPVFRTVELHALARLVGDVYNASNMAFTGKPGKYIWKAAKRVSITDLSHSCMVSELGCHYVSKWIE
jgi:hypothetical protein